MRFLPRTLERMRTALFGAPAIAAPAPVRRAQAHCPTPEAWAARIVRARARRAAERAPAVELDDVGVLVRAYVLAPEERQHALSASPGAGLSDAWERVR